MPGTHPEWALQYHIDQATANKFTEPELFVSIKCEAKSKNAPGFSLGLYDPGVGQMVVDRNVMLPEVSGSGYHAYSLGRHKLKSGMYLWVCPPNSGDISGVFVDRMFMVK